MLFKLENKWQLIPHLMRALAIKERDDYYCLFIALLLKDIDVDKSTLYLILDDFTAQYESEVFDRNLALVKKEL